MGTSFRAIIAEARADGTVAPKLGSRPLDALPPGEVRVRVAYSSLNYKDALSATGNRGVTRSYPHTPGVDAAGVVAASAAPGIAVGQEVIVTGYDLGMNTPGGWADYTRVPAGWVVPKPDGLTLREAMALGTAGLTAALSVDALRSGGVEPGAGPVLVTGATGGVGCLAVCILSKAGYAVTAATGKAEQHAFLRELGASEVVSRESATGPADKPLLAGRWAGAIDTVGGVYLDGALRATRRGGVVTACGLVASPQLETNVFPFILRGVRLQGIDTAETPMAERLRMWALMAGVWKPAVLERVIDVVALEALPERITAMLAGHGVGRTVVNVGAA